MNKRYKKANIASIMGILGNIFLLIIKLMISLITKSQAMLSDAINSAGDIYSSLMTFIGNKIASKKADDDHNLGHGKAEYIFSLFISITIILISLSLMYKTITSIFSPNELKYSPFLIIVCIVTILTKFLLYKYTSKVAKDYNNILMEANAIDHRNDCFLTIGTLISSILVKYGFQIIDAVVGLLISLWILKQGLSLFKKSYDVLMDKSMSDEVKNKIIEIVKKYDEIKKINHFNSTPIGYRYQVSLTIFIDGNLSTFESHAIADKLEDEITELDEVYLAIIHVNPI